LIQEGDRERGIVIAHFPLDILDYQETDMKNARLIKRNSLSEQLLTEDHRKADSQPVTDVRVSDEMGSRAARAATDQPTQAIRSVV